MLKRKIEQKLKRLERRGESQTFDHQGLQAVRQDVFCP